MFAFKKFPEFITNDICQDLVLWFEYVFAKDIYKSSDRENIRELNTSEIEKLPVMNNILNDIEQLIQDEGNYEVKFDKLWLVKTADNDSNRNELPYIPHFDKKRFLKALVYLNNVELEDGPIHLASEIDPSIEEKRKKLPKNYKSRKLNLVKTETNNKLKPITGNAGTLILFDTNTPHHAGDVSIGRMRKVLRFDFEDQSWNKVSLLQRVMFWNRTV